MRLKLENFAKIKEADIMLDGITVIGGDNNTGKSTIGKVLFGVYLVTDNVEERTEQERSRETARAYREYLQEIDPYIYLKKPIEPTSQNVSWLREETNYSASKENSTISKKEIYKHLLDDWRAFGDSKFKNYEEGNESLKLDERLKPYVERLWNVSNIANDDIVRVYIDKLFHELFHGQINSLVSGEQEAVIQCTQNNKEINISFRSNECSEYSKTMSVFNQAVYIANPYIVDELFQDTSASVMDNYLKDLLKQKRDLSKMDKIVDSVLAKEKLEGIYKVLAHVVSGKITEHQSNVFCLEDEAFSKPIRIENLSAGVKSFVILKMLLEKGSLKEKDVLILDEPEIHMHPQWQLIYAELIVLLQKNFNLTILITTHSPYFLDAINLYSIKHGIDKKVNYYLSSMEENQVTMKNVTDNIDEIYKDMATPTDTLDTLRYELFNN